MTNPPERPTREAGRADYQQRREQRVAGLQVAANRELQTSASAYKRSGEGLPDNGQPILVGHHSEAGHRRAIERSHGQMRKSVDAANKAQELSDRAAAAAANRAISSDNPDALQLLRDKLEKLEERRALALRINKAARGKNPVEALRALGLKETTIQAVMKPSPGEKPGVPNYEITNSAAEARRLRARIAELELRAQTAAPEPVERGAFQASWSTEDNRVVVDGPRPRSRAEKERRTELLRGRGFVFSHTEDRWQRQANDRAWREAVEVLGLLDAGQLDRRAPPATPEPPPATPEPEPSLATPELPATPEPPAAMGAGVEARQARAQGERERKAEKKQARRKPPGSSPTRCAALVRYRAAASRVKAAERAYAAAERRHQRATAAVKRLT